MAEIVEVGRCHVILGSVVALGNEVGDVECKGSSVEVQRGWKVLFDDAEEASSNRAPE